MADDPKKELWVGWTHDAMSRYVIPDEIDDADEQVDDMVEIATKYADAMLEEFEERFSGGRTRKRSKKVDPDDDDDDD